VSARGSCRQGVRHNQCFRQSLLATALTRWYSRQELKVAAFKAQNMINNARVANGAGKVNRSAIVIVSMQVALRSSILREVIKWRISTQEQKAKNWTLFLFRPHRTATFQTST
jgi:hypothetical protein